MQRALDGQQVLQAQPGVCYLAADVGPSRGSSSFSGAKPTIRIFSFFVQISGSRMRGKSAAGAARLRGAAALAAPVGDRGWPGCRSAAAAPPQQVRRNRSWRLDEALSVQPDVKQGVQEGGQLAVCRTYPDPGAVGIVVW